MFQILRYIRGVFSSPCQDSPEPATEPDSARPGSYANLSPELREEYRRAMQIEDWRERLKAMDRIQRRRLGIK